ncbi:MAG TPA: TonB-dependent receptor [Pricia sp.]|nr:TonB-dependent receptor [Pricia sp.]
MKPIFTLFTLLFAVAVTAQVGRGRIEGIITSSEKIPLPDVNIQISGTDLGTVSGADGRYTITRLDQGSYTVVFSSVGYATEYMTVDLTKGQSKKIDVSLTEDRQQLGEVVVEGRENKYLVKEPSTSLRLRTEVAKLPQNIQIISNELLRDQQATSMMEGVIRNVSGATMLEHWGHFARINMRGFRLPAFRNGINVQDSWGPLSEDMAFVERIEFVKGPAGFMMSAGEPGGFYNVVTKKPTEKHIAMVSVQGGSFDFYRGNFDLGGKLSKNGKLLYRLNAMYQTGDTHRGHENAKRFGVAPALTYAITDNTSIITEMNFQNAESYIGSAYVFAPVEAGYGSLDRDFRFVDTNYPATDIEELTFFTTVTHDFSDHWGVSGKFAYLRYNQVGNSAWLSSIDDTGDAIRYVSIWDALSLGKFAQGYLFGDFSTGSISHKVLGGFDYTERNYWADFNQVDIVDTEIPFNIYNPVYGNTAIPEFDRSVPLRDRADNYTYGYTNRSFYAQDEIGLFDQRVRLTLAARYTNLYTVDKPENDTKLSPRAGISVDIMPTLTAYALYDQSFLAANGVNASGDFFEPIEANDIEGGLKKTFFGGRLRTSLGAYQITKQNVLVGDPENPDFSIQLGEIQSKGIEFDLQGQVTPELNVILNYANTHVEITEDTNPDNVGQRVAGHAKHVTNGWLNYSFPKYSGLKGFGASLGYQYQVDRATWTWGAENQSDLPDYFRLDGALSWSNNKIRVQLNVNNLLDEYLYSGANYGSYLYWQSEPGINGRLGVTYNF